MRRDTKLALVVAAVCIALGTWYIVRGKSSAVSTAPKADAPATAAKSPGGAQPPSVQTARGTGQLPPGVRPRHVPATGGNTQEGGPLAARTPGALGREAGPRPQPAASPAPGARPTGPQGLGQLPGPHTPLTSDRPAPSGMGAATQPAGARPGLSAPVPMDTPARLAAAGHAAPWGGQVGLAGSDAVSNATTEKQSPALRESRTIQGTQTHVVQAGETFTALAVKYYGHARYTNLIAKANPSVDPRKLQVGMKLVIPPAPQEAAAASPALVPGPAAPMASKSPAPRTFKPEPVPADRAYTVKPGEGWYALAQRFLGDGQRWTELYELNKERVPRNPHRIPPGAVIELPPDANLKAAASPTTRPASADKPAKPTE